MLIERRSYDDPKLGHLIKLLTDWINDELADQRIIVMKIDDDLYDGQVLQKLLGNCLSIMSQIVCMQCYNRR